MTRSPGTMRAIFAVPAAIAVLSLAALVIGLLGDGGYDLLAWIGLAVPVATIGWSWSRASRPRSTRQAQRPESST